MNNRHAGSRFLDGAVVLFALGNVTLFGAALTFRDIPDGNLPVLTGLGTAVMAVVTGYAVWRFKTPSVPTPDPAPVIGPKPPAGGSAVEPPPPQTITITHVLGDPGSPPPPPTTA